jgi:ribonuclease inhibitor
MKNSIALDFSTIENYDDFYIQIAQKLNLPDFFGNNLDALYDTLTANVEMPLEIEFVNMNLNQLEEFEDLLQTMEDAENEMDDFEFSFFLETYEDEEDFEGYFEDEDFEEENLEEEESDCEEE